MRLLVPSNIVLCINMLVKREIMVYSISILPNLMFHTIEIMSFVVN